MVIAIFAQDNYIYMASTGSLLRILSLESQNQNETSEHISTETNNFSSTVSTKSSQNIPGFISFYTLALIPLIFVKKYKKNIKK